MSKYTFYETSIVPHALEQALVNEGVLDASEAYYSDRVEISTPTGSEQQCQNAVDVSVVGDLYANKWLRVDEVQEDSAELLLQFLEVTNGTDTGYIQLTNARSDFAFYQALASSASHNPGVLPQVMPVIGGGLVCTTVEQVEGIVEVIRARLEYLYTGAALNSDGSAPEFILIVAIMNAPTQQALDDIQDTRT